MKEVRVQISETDRDKIVGCNNGNNKKGNPRRDPSFFSLGDVAL